MRPRQMRERAAGENVQLSVFGIKSFSLCFGRGHKTREPPRCRCRRRQEWAGGGLISGLSGCGGGGGGYGLQQTPACLRASILATRAAAAVVALAPQHRAKLAVSMESDTHTCAATGFQNPTPAPQILNKGLAVNSDIPTLSETPTPQISSLP